MTSPLDEKGDELVFPEPTRRVIGTLSATPAHDGMEVIAYLVKDDPELGDYLTKSRQAAERSDYGHVRLTDADQAQSALAAEVARIEELTREVERLRNVVAKDPKTLMIAFEDGDHMRLSRAAGDARKRAAMAEIAENEAKDCFWAIYPRYLELGGEPVSTEAARTELASQVKRLTEDNKALREMADQWDAWAEGLTPAEIGNGMAKREARIKALEEALRGLLVNPDKTSRAAARAILTQENADGQ